MSDEPQVSTATPEVTDQPPVEEKTYRYQATDERGQPIGRPTVIKYKTEEELAAGVQRAARAIEAAKRTPDPAPEAKEPTVAELQAKLNRIEEERAGAEFISHHPEYHNVEANGRLIADYLKSRGLPKTRNNIEIAFANLSNDGALIQRPTLEVTPAPPAADPNPTPSRPATPVAGVKPGSTTGRQIPSKPLTLADVYAMPPDEYKRRCKDPKFVAEVNRLGAERTAKRRTA